MARIFKISETFAINLESIDTMMKIKEPVNVDSFKWVYRIIINGVTQYLKEEEGKMIFEEWIKLKSF